MTTQLTPKTCWRFYKGSRGNLQTNSSGSQANPQTASLSSSTWDQTHWKTSNWNSKHSSSPDNWWFFLRVRTGSQPTGGVHSTPTNTARTELHSMITLHHANTRGSRAAKLRIAHLCVPKNNCHPRVMSHSLPHLTLTSRSSLSPFSSTSPSFPTVSPAQTRSMILDLNFTCDGPRQSGGSTQILSHRFWAQIGWDQSHRDRSDRACRPRAQKNWAWQESWDRSVSTTGKIYEKFHYWRCGW